MWALWCLNFDYAKSAVPNLAIQEETGGLMVCLPGHYRLLSRYPGYALQVKLGTIRENVDLTAVVCFILEKGLGIGGFFGVPQVTIGFNIKSYGFV